MSIGDVNRDWVAGYSDSGHTADTFRCLTARSVLLCEALSVLSVAHVAIERFREWASVRAWYDELTSPISQWRRQLGDLCNL